MATVANAAGEAGTKGDVVTTVNSTSAGKEDTQVYTQPTENLADSADYKRGAQFPSPASTTPAEKAHTRQLAERGYSVASGAGYAGEQDEVVGVGTVATSIVAGKTYTPVCSETAENPAAAGDVHKPFSWDTAAIISVGETGTTGCEVTKVEMEKKQEVCPKGGNCCF